MFFRSHCFSLNSTHRHIHFALYYAELDTIPRIVEVLLGTGTTCRWPQPTGCPPDYACQCKACLFSVMSILSLLFSLWSTTNSQCLHLLMLVPHLVFVLLLLLPSAFFPLKCPPDCFKLFPEFVEIFEFEPCFPVCLHFLSSLCSL